MMMFLLLLLSSGTITRPYVLVRDDDVALDSVFFCVDFESDFSIVSYVLERERLLAPKTKTKTQKRHKKEFEEKKKKKKRTK